MKNMNAHNKVPLLKRKDGAKLFKVDVNLNPFQRQLSTAHPRNNGRSPSDCESNINNSREIDLEDNNKQTSTVATPPKANIQRLSTANCYFATQDVKPKKAGKGYLNTPIEIPEKIKAKIHSVVYDAEKMKTVSSAKQVIAEAEFAVSRCFTGVSIEHATNTFFKLLRQEKWTTPIRIGMANPNTVCISSGLNNEGKK